MWQRLILMFRSRYVLFLEEEVARLKVENRALLNSLLGTVGAPPIITDEDAKPANAVPAVRRRSWHQIQKQGTMDSERKYNKLVETLKKKAAEPSAEKAS